MSLISELKRRNVFKVAMAYLALGWVVMQLTEIIVPVLNQPESAISIVVYIGIVGFIFDPLILQWNQGNNDSDQRKRSTKLR